MTFHEWEIEIQKMPKQQAAKYLDAIQVLRQWESFNREFSSNGLFVVSTLLEMRWTEENKKPKR